MEQPDGARCAVTRATAGWDGPENPDPEDPGPGPHPACLGPSSQYVHDWARHICAPRADMTTVATPTEVSSMLPDAPPSLAKGPFTWENFLYELTANREKVKGSNGRTATQSLGQAPPPLETFRGKAARDVTPAVRFPAASSRLAALPSAEPASQLAFPRS